MTSKEFDILLQKIRQCKICEPHLPLGANPVMNASIRSKVIIIGQAPGLKVHQTGIPWNDKSGDQLRSWLDVTSDSFYNPDNFAIIPMGFCYPGKGKSGDLPPRKECAPLWHKPLIEATSKTKLILLIGNYAQRYYLKEQAQKTLTETVYNFENYLPLYFPLPHPSPRNFIWQSKNPWFTEKVLPILKEKIKLIGI